jgi:Protein of unknown function (DUF1579)
MTFRNLLACVGIAVLAVGVAGAQDKKAAAPMDEKAMMEVMQKAATPGEGHKKLESMIGTFDAKVKIWMDPSKPPAESVGTSVNSWVLGNRFIETKHQGTFMGQPFSGVGYTGYDNTTKKYEGTWMDTASTGMMVSKGTMSGNVMTTSSTMADPTTGKMTTMKMKTTVADKDHYTMEMWGPGPDGKEHKMMEINYTRKM